ncbi:hypothetical protein jhhlp_006820 [Lomentospora prolificans]|uniref:SET domain-containing protein n=1 Tax=Lomentospora prolificans TaxID=41688 RepID=A0A2N3N2T7_9PEZI|nr:hypothetical protein jhhlp_006820 [Lomentospora prolificans]
MARLSTVGLGLISLSTSVALARSDILTYGDLEADEVTSGRGQCGWAPLDPLNRASSTCGLSLLQGFGTKPNEWFPWTHRPYCADTPYCVFTNAHFQGNQGVSIITTPELAAGTLDKLEETFTTVFQRTKRGPLYRVVDIPGKGRGAVAARKIKRGEKFMVDYAGLIADTAFPKSTKLAQGKKLLETAVDQLPRGGAIRDLAKSTNTTERVIEDLLRTNSFGMTLENRNIMVLFPEISRMNHACSPNAFIRFSEKTFANSAIAFRDIEPGEELTISYADFGMLRDERQDFLRVRWGFTCTCDLCNLPEDEVVASDARREKIRDIRDVVLKHVNKGEFNQAIKKHKMMIDLIVEEGMLVPLGEYYDIMARLYNTIGDRRNTEKWARMAIDDLELFGGEEIYEQVPELRDILDGI